MKRNQTHTIKPWICCCNSGNNENICDGCSIKAAGGNLKLIKIIWRIDSQRTGCWNADPPADVSVYDKCDFVLAHLITVEEVRYSYGDLQTTTRQRGSSQLEFVALLCVNMQFTHVLLYLLHKYLWGKIQNYSAPHLPLYPHEYHLIYTTYYQADQISEV